MRDLPWFRLYSDSIDNEKLRLLAFEDRWHFVAILCCKNQGIIDSSDHLLERKLSVKLGVQLRELEEIKRRLVEVNLIDENWQPVRIGPEYKRPPSHEWREIREQIFLRDDYTCGYCGERGGRLECDHVTPVSRGGGSEDSNLITACFNCNRSKRDKTIEEWIN